ncbi:MAG: hypothetical protein GY719_36420 [bacterium]|nr:hypothetical protein [bacterium]
MRDLARSMIRFSWAMSVLGARQMSNFVSPREGWDRSADAFDAVSHAAAEEMGETMKSFYRAGDRLQSGMVDSMSRLVRGNWSDPGKPLNEAWESVDRTWTGIKDELATDSTDEE